MSKFESLGIKYERVIQNRDFQRIMVYNNFQLDFVNDHVYRYGKSSIIKGFKVDNIINIFTNKISAVINRDEEKDIFDIFAVSRNQPYNWGEILKIAKKKANIDKSVLIQRLKSFPLEWLSNIQLLKPFIIKEDDICRMCIEIQNEKDNSLCAG